MNKRILILMTTCLLLFLNGCQLALPNGDIPTNPDRLVGVFITFEPLNKFDFDTYFEENIDDILNEELPNAENIATSMKSADLNNNKIYGELIDNSYVNEYGVTVSNHCYKFKDLEGLPFCYYIIPAQNDGTTQHESYWTADAGEGISDISRYHGITDEGVSLKLEGTVYMNEEISSLYITRIFCNPVYQTADGQVYILPADMSTCPEVTETLSESSTITESEKEEGYSIEIKISFFSTTISDRVIFIEMDKNNIEICREEFIPGQLPEEYEPNEDTAYILVEEHKDDTVTRSLFQPGSEEITAYYSLDNGICVEDCTTVNWSKASY